MKPLVQKFDHQKFLKFLDEYMVGESVIFIPFLLLKFWFSDAEASEPNLKR